MRFQFGKRNQDILEAKADIPYWMIAERLGVHENTVKNWVRKEMDPIRKKTVLAAIAEVKEEIRTSILERVR